MVIKNVFIYVIIFWITLSFSYAAPSVTNVTGLLTDGSTMTITGTAFTTHALDAEFLGGKTGTIESTLIGSVPSKTDWTFFGWNEDADVQSAQFHSGTRSIKIPLKDDGSANFYAGTIRYNYADGVSFGDQMFVSWWVRQNHTKTVGEANQWKMIRGCWQNSITDAAGVQFRSFDRDPANEFFIANTDGSSATDTWYLNNYPSTSDTWFRIDLTITPESSDGADDGYFVWTRHEPGVAITTNTKSDVTCFNGSNDFYKWILWQNYVGNGITASTVWMDDLYIQTGISRIEIGDNAVYASCTKREIQEPSAWSTTSATAEMNVGSFQTDDTGYVFIVDTNGDASGGYEITIGGTATNPVIVMSGSGTEVSVDTPVVMHGTATATTGRTIASASSSPSVVWTCDDGTCDEQIEAMSATSNTLDVGLNSYLVTVEDNTAETGQDTFTITYAPEESSGSKSPSGSYTKR